jgi:uncharacterized protein (TIGR03435 family)
MGMMKMMKIAMLCGIVCVAIGVSAQSVTDAKSALQFEVISVKEHAGYSGQWPIQMNWAPDGFTAEGISVKLMVANAYGLRPDRVVGGPGWVSGKTFDVSAKIAPEDVERMSKMSPHDKNAMLQQVLRERFGVKAHTEARMVSIYRLVLGKNFKLQPTTDSAEEQKMKARLVLGNAFMRVTDMEMRQLVSALTSVLQTPVVDGTELHGFYSFELRWNPESTTATGGDDQYPYIFTAVKEQLGLELKAEKGPVDFLVIDSASLPSAN